ncbi:MAG: hypothetical protein Q6L60_00570 [Thermostichus sp. HHBFW_bins_43]
MVILDYASTDHDHVAVTTDGFLESIRFQNHFYAFNRSFRTLKEAVDSCRHDMDYGSLVSIVVVRSDRCEVWSQLGSEIPVVPKCLLSTTLSQPAAPAKPRWLFRNWGRSIPANAYFVDGEPSPRRPLFYRGARPYNALQA